MKPIRHTLASARPISPIVCFIAALGGIGAALSGASPTGSQFADLFWCALLGVAVSMASAHAHRLSWLFMVSVTVLTASGASLVPALLAAILAIVGVRSRRRSAALGAAIGALSVTSLLQMDLGWFHGDSALVTLVAIAPVLVSGRSVARTKLRKRVRVGGFVIVGLCVLAGGAFALAAFQAQSEVEAGIADSRSALEAVRDGRSAAALTQLERASESLGRADDLLNSPLAQPARLVPIIGQNAHALGVLTADGARLSATARDSVQQVDYEQLKYDAGQFNIARIEAAQAPLAAAADAAELANSNLSRIDTTWLVSPLRTRIADYEDEVRRASSDAQRAADVVAIAPGMLGGEGERKYLVAFVTPAEMRGSGGFIGSYGELTARNGELRLTRSGPISDLIDAVPKGTRTLSGPADYLARYGAYQPQDYLQDITLSPNFASVAEVFAELYPQSGGTKVDGVLQVDPYGLAALLKLTGPITIDGIPEPLTAKNAARILLKDQYTLFGVEDEQNDALDAAARETFEQLTTGSLPAPRAVVNALGPLVDEGRFKFHSFDTAEQQVVTDSGLAWDVPTPHGQDLLAITTQNNGNSKIDVFLQRTVNYDVKVDPETGKVRATATVRLENSAPAFGLPRVVIGNNRDLPNGTSRIWLSLYSGLRLDQLRIGSLPIPVTPEREAGYSVYGAFLNVGPGETVEATFELSGQTATPDLYEFEYFPQPMVNPDKVNLSVDIGQIPLADRKMDMEGTTLSGQVEAATLTSVAVSAADKPESE